MRCPADEDDACVYVFFKKKRHPQKNMGKMLEKFSLTRCHARLSWHQLILSVKVTHALIPRVKWRNFDAKAVGELPF